VLAPADRVLVRAALATDADVVVLPADQNESNSCGVDRLLCPFNSCPQVSHV
jgi:hypothetical protein